jgi:hypothetical protein
MQPSSALKSLPRHLVQQPPRDDLRLSGRPLPHSSTPHVAQPRVGRSAGMPPEPPAETWRQTKKEDTLTFSTKIFEG